MARIARCFRSAVPAFLIALVPAATWAQAKTATVAMQPHIGFMRVGGMAGVVASVTSSEMQLNVPEHVTFAVHFEPSTQVIENGHSASVSSIQAGSAALVHGKFDMHARTVNAATVVLMPPNGLRMLRIRTANFGKTWTVGIVTAIQPESIAVQQMDGMKETVKLDANTAYDFHNRPVSPAWLRVGERVDIEFQQDQPFIAGRLFIQGMAQNN